MTLAAGENYPDADFGYLLPAPAIELLKTGTLNLDVVSPAGVANVGDQITYEFTVTNTGNVTLNDVSVTDPVITVLGGPTITLAPLASDSTTFTGVYTLTQIDINNGSFTNTAEATGTPSTGGEDVTDDDDDTQTLPAVPEMALTKTASAVDTAGNGILDRANELIGYTITVENTGNIALTGVSVSDPLLTDLDCDAGTPGSQTSGFSIAVGGTLTCTGSYAVTQTDLDDNGGGDGDIDNTVSADSAETPSEDASAEVPLGQSPLIGLAKRVVSVTEITAGTYDVTYELLVQNYGSAALSALQVTDDLRVTFLLPTTFAVQSVSSVDFAENTAYDGATDLNLLLGSDTLAFGASGTITVVVRVVPAEAGPFNNTAIASGTSPANTVVTDDSQNGVTPDPDENDDPTDNDDPTPVDFGPGLFDPPIGFKVVDGSGLPLLRWTMTWINNSNIVAVNARVSDPIPAGTTYSAAGAPSGFALPGGAPAGSTNVGVSCTSPGATTTSLCYYEGPTATYPRGQIVWEGSLEDDFGAIDAASAANELVIAFNLRVPSQTRRVNNIASIDSDLNGDGDPDDPNETAVDTAAATWNAPADEEPTAAKKLPSTGFAPGVISQVPPQPQSSSYPSYQAGELQIEIPALAVKQTIVGVPYEKGTWNVTWLDKHIGYLNGTAFPTFEGNSALTGHVYLPNGKPGPFVNLGQLKWGDQINIYSYGQKFIYEVRSKVYVQPDDTSVLGHQDQPWLTLLTCKVYDEKSNQYLQRVAVQAVLVSVEDLPAK